MLWQLAAVLAALAAWYYRWRRRAIYRVAAEIPSGLPGPSLPVLGHAYILTGTDEDRMKTFQVIGRVALRQGGMSTAWMLNRLYVVVADAAAAAVVVRRCVDKDDATMRFIRTLIGNGSIFAPVPIWRPRRKVLAPVFGARRVAALVPVFARHAAAAAAQLAAHEPHADFSLWDTLSAYTFDAVCETSLGVSLRSQGGTPHPFLRAFAGAQRILSRRMCAPWQYPDAVFRALPAHRRFVRYRRQIHRFIDEVIRQKRKELASSESKEEAEEGSSFLEQMLAGGALSDRELREEVMVLVMAGSDTTAGGAGFALLLLAQHPRVQDELLAELRSVLGSEECARAPAAADLARLTYLEAVLKETLRLYPPVPVTVREVHQDVTLPCGRVLPAGVAVLVHAWAAHRNRCYWGADADVFRPERFLEAPLRHPAQFMPFGHSVRNCLGSQYAMLAMKTVVAAVLRRVRVLPAGGARAAGAGAEPLRVKFDIVMKHVDDYTVRVEPRPPPSPPPPPAPTITDKRTICTSNNYGIPLVPHSSP